MRDYEITLVLNAELDDETREQVLARALGWIKAGGDGETEPAVTHWGQRQLAYPINKQRNGHYVLIETQIDPANVNEIERNIRFVDDILRHLVVRKDS